MEYQPAISRTSQWIYDKEARSAVNAELQLKYCLCDWASKDNSPQLKALLHEHPDLTEMHINKAENLFERHKAGFFGLPNRLMQVHIDELIKKPGSSSDITLKEAFLVSGIKAICDFKTAAYGMADFACNLGFIKAADLFNEAGLNEKNIRKRFPMPGRNRISYYNNNNNKDGKADRL